MSNGFYAEDGMGHPKWLDQMPFTPNMSYKLAPVPIKDEDAHLILDVDGLDKLKAIYGTKEQEPPTRANPQLPVLAAEHFATADGKLVMFSSADYHKLSTNIETIIHGLENQIKEMNSVHDAERIRKYGVSLDQWYSVRNALQNGLEVKTDEA